MFDTEDEARDSSNGGDDRLLTGVAEAASPLQLRRVAKDFNATEFDYTEQVRACMCGSR